MTDTEERDLDIVLEQFDEWLGITGAVPKQSSWRWEIESFFDDAYDAGFKKANKRPECDENE